MTIQIQTSGGPVAMTEPEKLELLQAAGAAPADHLVADDPHPGKFAAQDHAHTGLMTTGQSAKLDALPTAAALADAQAAQDLAINGKADGGHTHTLLMTQPERDKLGGVADGATANAADAVLRDRATHTGAQAISTVDGLQTALDAKVDASKIGAASGVAELDSTGKLRASQIPASALVDVSATGMTLSAGVLTLTQDDGGPSAVLDLNSFATDAELAAGLAGKASAAQGAAAATALQPGTLPVGTTLPAAQISDAGAAGRDILRMATLAEIQASVSGDRIPLAQKGVANGVATLDASGKLTIAQLPASALVDVNATGATLSAGVLQFTQDDGGPTISVDLNSFATDTELNAGLAGRATSAQGAKADAALQPIGGFYLVDLPVGAAPNIADSAYKCLVIDTGVATGTVRLNLSAFLYDEKSFGTIVAACYKYPKGSYGIPSGMYSEGITSNIASASATSGVKLYWGVKNIDATRSNLCFVLVQRTARYQASQLIGWAAGLGAVTATLYPTLEDAGLFSSSLLYQSGTAW